MELTFASRVPKSFFEELNALFFFNPNQALYSDRILHSIETFGVPKIVAEGDSLRLSVGEDSRAQTLFAVISVDGAAVLGGAVTYTRAGPETLDLIHVAIREEYGLFGALGDQRLLARMLEQMKVIARRIKGVRVINVVYAHRTIVVK